MAIDRAQHPGCKPGHITDYLLHAIHQLLQITISLWLLPLDNAILLTCSILSRTTISNHRQKILQNVHFYPKTVLLTGIDTPEGLSLARHWQSQGHRVIGADIHSRSTSFRVRPGGSMSNTLSGYYPIPRAEYTSRILDIVNREKVDIWIPASSAQISVVEDALAKQVIEARTACVCVHLDAELMGVFGHRESFSRFLGGKNLPVVESHCVRSRDSVHRILHRSPTKTYQMRRLRPVLNGKDEVVFLPKRTVSLTYSEVSELAVSEDVPWVLQQQSRLGEFIAEMLVIRGSVHAIHVRPVAGKPAWGGSRTDEALVVTIHNLMERFARETGTGLTGHLAVNLMVDEEYDTNSVRHVVSIVGCEHGTAAVRTLLHDPPSPIVPAYLELLSPAEKARELPARIFPSRSRRLSMRDISDILKLIGLPPDTVELVDMAMSVASQYVFWTNPRFSWHDPMPWWWDVHIVRPLRVIGFVE